MDSTPPPLPSPVTSLATRSDYLALAAAIGLMIASLSLHLLSALIAGLLMHELVLSLSRRLKVANRSHGASKVLALVLLSAILIAVLSFGVVNFVNFLRHGADGLLGRLAEALDTSRDRLPSWLGNFVPTDVAELQSGAVAWLREHSSTLQGVGTSFGRVLAHILIGMIIGAMLAMREPLADNSQRGPLARIAAERFLSLASAFRRVVFAQAWIATINAAFTWIYLGVALPLFGVEMPQVKTLLIVTWICGLLPIIGNLISNTVIVAVAFGVSVHVAISSLVFLVVVHKLGYFLNARIIGSQIRSSAWELLVAMLVMETAFGISGLIAAPIFYAYLKDELARLRLI